MRILWVLVIVGLVLGTLSVSAITHKECMATCLSESCGEGLTMTQCCDYCKLLCGNSSTDIKLDANDSECANS